jgi:hypothetical protein
MGNELINLSGLEGKNIVIEIIVGDESEVATGTVKKFGSSTFGVVCGSETISAERILSIIKIN